MPEYETVTGTPAGEHVTHEPRTITRRDLDEGGGQRVAMMSEIRDGTFVQWSTCTTCWNEVAGCKCPGGPQEPDYISRWRESRFRSSLDERPEPERELLPSLLRWLKDRGYEVTTATQHRPLMTLHLDVFGPDSPTPREAAETGWDTVRRWVREGYEPIVTVAMPDGTKHEIDLEHEEDERAESAPDETIQQDVTEGAQTPTEHIETERIETRATGGNEENA